MKISKIGLGLSTTYVVISILMWGYALWCHGSLWYTRCYYYEYYPTWPWTLYWATIWQTSENGIIYTPSTYFVCVVMNGLLIYFIGWFIGFIAKKIKKLFKD